MEITLGVKSLVSTSDVEKTLTGLYGTDLGWKWSQTFAQSHADLESRQNTFIGKVDNAIEATALTDWNSGVVNGIVLQEISNTKQKWVPIYSTGSYSLYWNSRKLFSDYSYVSRIDRSENTNGLNRIQLREDCLIPTIEVGIWQRHNNLIFKCKGFEFVEAFTGLLVDGERTEMDPSDATENETRVSEFLIDSGYLYLNQDHYIEIAGTEDRWENIGVVRAGRIAASKFFPVEESSFQLKSVYKEVYTEWTLVDNFLQSGSTDLHYMVDFDLGLIKLGGIVYPKLYLDGTINASTTTLEVVGTPEVNEYPIEGILLIDTEEIYYGSRVGTTFTNCVRAFNSTVAATHTSGAATQETVRGGVVEGELIISYKAIPRVEYEIDNHNQRTANFNGELDIKHLKYTEPSKIIQIMSKELNVSKVVLEADTNIISGDLYGPLYFGLGNTRLKATAYDSQNNVVTETPISIQIENGPGFLNGNTRLVNGLTNGEGEFSVIFNAPYDRNVIEQNPLSITQTSTDTEIELRNLDYASQLKDIWLFQVYKWDKSLGTTGLKVEIDDLDTTIYPYGSSYIDLQIAYSEDYNGGHLYYFDGLVRKHVEIIRAEPIELSTTEPGLRLYLKKDVTADLSIGDFVWLFESQSTEFNPVLNNGLKRIVYAWDDTAIHPITEDSGAWTPLHPTSRQDNILVFEDRLLPIGDSEDWNTNLAGYVVITPVVVTVVAYAIDPASGMAVRSNRIRLRIQLPNYMIGVSYDAGLPIPHGFTFVSDEHNVGTGLGGANFITINPQANLVTQFTITEDI